MTVAAYFAWSGRDYMGQHGTGRDNNKAQLFPGRSPAAKTVPRAPPRMTNARQLRLMGRLGVIGLATPSVLADVRPHVEAHAGVTAPPALQ